MMMNPALVRFLAYLGALVTVFVVGLEVMHTHDAKTIAALTATYQSKLDAATAAKAAAEERATKIESAQSASIAAAVNTYKTGTKDEKIRTDAVIADLRSSNKRLLVRTNRPACSGSLPGAGPAPAGSDGPAPETLAGSVAARLAGRYADYNLVVDQLTLCQATLQADRQYVP